MPCIYRRTLFRTVPACLYWPAMLKMVNTLANAKSLASAENFTDFCQTLVAEISAPRPLIEKPKKIKNGQAGLFCKTPPPRASRLRPSWRSIAGKAGDTNWCGPAGGAGEGRRVEEDIARALIASGYAWGRGANPLLTGPHLPSPFVPSSYSTLSFNFFFAYLSGWL